jgi:hypothetical protein
VVDVGDWRAFRWDSFFLAEGDGAKKKWHGAGIVHPLRLWLSGCHSMVVAGGCWRGGVVVEYCDVKDKRGRLMKGTGYAVRFG